MLSILTRSFVRKRNNCLVRSKLCVFNYVCVLGSLGPTCTDRVHNAARIRRTTSHHIQSGRPMNVLRFRNATLRVVLNLRNPFINLRQVVHPPRMLHPLRLISQPSDLRVAGVALLLFLFVQRLQIAQLHKHVVLVFQVLLRDL